MDCHGHIVYTIVQLAISSFIGSFISMQANNIVEYITNGEFINVSMRKNSVRIINIAGKE